MPPPPPPLLPSASPPPETFRGCVGEAWKHFTEKVDDPKASQRTDAILIAASVIAAMNYQAVLSPPRGVYQDTKYRNNNTFEYRAGESIGAYLDPHAYKCFYMANTISFTSSMTTMFMLLCGVSLQRKIFTVLTTGTMFASITATAYSYTVALRSITPNFQEPYLVTGFVQQIVAMALIGWIVVATLILLYFLETQIRGSPPHKWVESHLRDFYHMFKMEVKLFGTNFGRS